MSSRTSRRASWRRCCSREQSEPAPPRRLLVHERRCARATHHRCHGLDAERPRRCRRGRRPPALMPARTHRRDRPQLSNEGHEVDADASSEFALRRYVTRRARPIDGSGSASCNRTRAPKIGSSAPRCGAERRVTTDILKPSALFMTRRSRCRTRRSSHPRSAERRRLLRRPAFPSSPGTCSPHGR